MTTIKIFKQNNKICGFECNGHTGFADAGADIVCASISSLVGACHLGLSKVLGLETKFEIDEKQGFFALRLSSYEAENESAQAILKTFVESARELASNYRKFIKIIN